MRRFRRRPMAALELLAGAAIGISAVDHLQRLRRRGRPRTVRAGDRGRPAGSRSRVGSAQPGLRRWSNPCVHDRFDARRSGEHAPDTVAGRHVGTINAVAHVFCNKPAEAAHRLGDALLIRGDDLADKNRLFLFSHVGQVGTPPPQFRSRAAILRRRRGRAKLTLIKVSPRCFPHLC